jgi:hypothetical protein
VEIPGTTDSQNILFFARKYLILLPQQILRATGESCIHSSACDTLDGHGLHGAKLEKRLRSLEADRVQGPEEIPMRSRD